MGLVYKICVGWTERPARSPLVRQRRGVALSVVYRTTRRILSALTVAVRQDISKDAESPDHYTRCPRRSPNPTRAPASTSEDTTASAASCTNIIMPLELRGWSFRQAQGASFWPDRRPRGAASRTGSSSTTNDAYTPQPTTRPRPRHAALGENA